MLFKLKDKFPINFSNPIWASSLAVSHVPPLLINVERSSRFSDRDNWFLLKLPVTTQVQSSGVHGSRLESDED